MAAETTSNPAEKKKGKVANVLSTVFLVICVLFVIFCSFTAYTSSAGSGVPSLFGYRFFSIQTESMAPFFKAGDLVIDKKVDDPAALKEQDVITFWTVINGQKALNTHRIIEVKNMENYIAFTTKGDNNRYADTYDVHQNDVVGVYSTHIKGLGTVLDFLETPKGFLICLVLPMAIFFIYEIISFFKTLSAYNREKVRLQVEEEKKKNEEATKAAVAAALAAAGFGKPAAAEPAAEKPAAEKPAEEAAAEKPAAAEPAAEKPAEEAAAEKPAAAEEKTEEAGKKE